MLTGDSGKYCCPSDSPLHDCTLRGTTPDCADAKCKPDEVAIATNNENCWCKLFLSCKYQPTSDIQFLLQQGQDQKRTAAKSPNLHHQSSTVALIPVISIPLPVRAPRTVVFQSGMILD